MKKNEAHSSYEQYPARICVNSQRKFHSGERSGNKGKNKRKYVWESAYERSWRRETWEERVKRGTRNKAPEEISRTKIHSGGI